MITDIANNKRFVCFFNLLFFPKVYFLYFLQNNFFCKHGGIFIPELITESGVAVKLDCKHGGIFIPELIPVGCAESRFCPERINELLNVGEKTGIKIVSQISISER